MGANNILWELMNKCYAVIVYNKSIILRNITFEIIVYDG